MRQLPRNASSALADLDPLLLTNKLFPASRERDVVSCIAQVPRAVFVVSYVASYFWLHLVEVIISSGEESGLAQMPDI